LDSLPRIYAVAPGVGEPLRQGEILSYLVQAHLKVDSLQGEGPPELLSKVHPFAIILSQDCDLEQDFKARGSQVTSDKIIPNILFCEVITAEQLRGSGGVNSTIWARIRTNKDERYQFFQKVQAADDALGQGLPELSIDFKRYFTIPADEAYWRVRSGEAKRRCVLVSPYLEHLSRRFASYLGRVALPQEHASE
jgi:hypothetical protein